jgi:hypothetical protein
MFMNRTRILSSVVSALSLVFVCGSSNVSAEEKKESILEKAANLPFRQAGSIFNWDNNDRGAVRDSRFPLGYGWGGQTIDTNKENCAKAKAQFASPPCSNKCTAISTGGFNVGSVMGTLGGFLGGGSGGSLLSTIMSSVGSRGSVPESCQATCQFLQLNCDGRLADAYKKLYDRCEKAIDDRKKEEDNYLKTCSKLGVSNCVDSINRCQSFLSARTAAEQNGAVNPGNMNQLYAQACPHLACADMNEQKEVAKELADELKETQSRLQDAQNETIQAYIRDDDAFSQMRMGFLENERNIVGKGNDLAEKIQQSSEDQEIKVMQMSEEIAALEFKMKELMNVRYVKAIQNLDAAYAAVDNECRAKAGAQMEKERAVIKERTRSGEGVSHLSMMRAQLFNLESEMSDDKEGYVYIPQDFGEAPEARSIDFSLTGWWPLDTSIILRISPRIVTTVFGDLKKRRIFKCVVCISDLLRSFGKEVHQKRVSRKQDSLLRF